MKTRVTFTTLLPALVSFIPLHAHTSSISEDEMIVTGNAAADATDSAAGVGFKTDDIDVGPLGAKSWIETPYSSITVTEEVIENQQAQSVSEILKYSPSTQIQACGRMGIGRLQSRGMQGSMVANSRLDGLNIISTTVFPVEILERMDVLNSLTGALYGPASPVRQFDFVARRLAEETLRKVTLGYQSRGVLTGHADLGGHFDENKRFGYRVNLLDRKGGGNVDGSTLRHKLVSVALDQNIQPGTQLQLNAGHCEFIQKGYVGSFNHGPNIKLPSVPNPKGRDLTLSTAGNDLTTDTISTRLIRYFNDNWSMSAGVDWQQAGRTMRSVSSKILNNQDDISRSMKDSIAAGRSRILSNTAGPNGHINTGSIDHDLSPSTAGCVWSPYGAKEAGSSYSWGTTNMYHPDAIDERGDGKIRTGGPRYRSSVNTQQSVTLGNTVTFTPQWSVTFYLSQGWLQTKNYDRHGNQTNQVGENGLSSSAVLMCRITPSTMAYISYIDSLEQGGTAPTDESIKSTGQTLNPYRNKQYEVELKSDIGEMNLGAALFRLEHPFAYLDTDNVYKEQDNQVNSGLGLTAAGNVWQGLNIYSGVTFLSPKLKDTTNASTSNKQIVGVPEVQADPLAEYSLLSIPEWVYSANVHYTGKRATNDTSTSYASSYTT